MLKFPLSKENQKKKLFTRSDSSKKSSCVDSSNTSTSFEDQRSEALRKKVSLER
jgi:hypothetical protein